MYTWLGLNRRTPAENGSLTVRTLQTHDWLDLELCLERTNPKMKSDQRARDPRNENIMMQNSNLCRSIARVLNTRAGCARKQPELGNPIIVQPPQLSACKWDSERADS